MGDVQNDYESVIYNPEGKRSLGNANVGRRVTSILHSLLLQTGYKQNSTKHAISFRDNRLKLV
jgi:hypothetical protein